MIFRQLWALLRAVTAPRSNLLQVTGVASKHLEPDWSHMS
jgi:hypothetical protein